MECVLFLLSNNQETPSPERHGHGKKSEVVHHVTGKLYPQGHDGKHCCRKTLSPSDACPSASQVCKSVLFGSGTPDENCVRPGCRISAVSHRTRSAACLMENISPEAKRDGTQLCSAVRMLPDDLVQV
jgi:hypothetical protein